MRKAVVKELTLESFLPYGTFVDMLNPKTVKIGEDPIEFFRDMIQVDLGCATKASFSTCRIGKRPYIIDYTECHSTCGEGILPLDGDILIHVAAATPNGVEPFDDIEVYKVPKGTFIALRPGVWHHGPFICNDNEYTNILNVIPERLYANDCIVLKVPENKLIEICFEEE